jgi:hypothetical protein
LPCVAHHWQWMCFGTTEQSNIAAITFQISVVTNITPANCLIRLWMCSVRIGFLLREGSKWGRPSQKIGQEWRHTGAEGDQSKLQWLQIALLACSTIGFIQKQCKSHHRTEKLVNSVSVVTYKSACFYYNLVLPCSSFPIRSSHPVSCLAAFSLPVRPTSWARIPISALEGTRLRRCVSEIAIKRSGHEGFFLASAVVKLKSAFWWDVRPRHVSQERGTHVVVNFVCAVHKRCPSCHSSAALGRRIFLVTGLQDFSFISSPRRHFRLLDSIYCDFVYSF